MKKIEFEELPPIDEYEKVRDPFRQEVIALKEKRAVRVGPALSLVFQNRDTVLFQLLEKIRTERLHDRSQIEGEIRRHNDLIPGERQLAARVEILGEDLQTGKRLSGLDRENGLYLQIARKKKVPAAFEPVTGRDATGETVGFVRFKWSFVDIETFRMEKESYLVIDHPDYKERAAIGEEMKKMLLEELDDPEG